MHYILLSLVIVTFVFVSDGWILHGDYGSLSATAMKLQYFSDELSVCNDGSQGGYYFSPALEETKKNVFLVYLPGGGQCYDEGSCQYRWNTTGTTFMSNSGFSDTIYKTGILDSDSSQSPLWGANKALLAYCSSDGYMGDATASNETWGWHFRGQQLVISMFKSLMKDHQMNSNSTIILAGGSAGARGMMTMIDLLVSDILPVGSKVVGFLDSPYYIDILPFPEGVLGFQYQEQQKYKYLNTLKVLSSECISMYPTLSDQWKCQFGEYRIPFLKTPYFLIASQYDSYQLSTDTQTAPPYSEDVLEYSNEFGNRTQYLMKGLIDLAKDNDKIDRAYFSWACYNHDVSDTPDFAAKTSSDGISPRDAFEIYLNSSPYIIVGNDATTKQKNNNNLIKSSDATYYWLDNCVGFACGTGCN